MVVRVILFRTEEQPNMEVNWIQIYQYKQIIISVWCVDVSVCRTCAYINKIIAVQTFNKCCHSGKLPSEYPRNIP